MLLTSSIPYQRNLDGVRGIAIVLVMMQHQQILGYGWIGVPLFFILSGYLITKILVKQRQTDIPLKLKLRNFWMRRILRIFPIYFLYLSILIAVAFLVGNASALIQELPYLFTYTYNCSLSSTLDFSYTPILHLWSLSVEEQFYLFYPFIILLLNKRYLKFCVIFLIVFTVCFRFFYTDFLESSYPGDPAIRFEKAYYLIFSHFDSFLLGASIVIFDLEKIPARIQSLLLILTSVVFLGSGIYLFRNEFGEIESAVIVYLRNFGYSFVNMRYQWPFIVLNLFLFTLVLTLVAAKKGMISRWLNNFFQLPALVSIGRVSYGMYVIHMGLIPVLGYYKNKVSFFDNGYVYSLFYCLIVYMLAVLLYHLFEKRFLSLKVRFT